MTATPNLALEHLESGTASPEVVTNAIDDGLDHAMNSSLTINFSSDADYTLSTSGSVPQQWQNGTIVFTDTGPVLTTGRNVIVPNNERIYRIVNNTAQTLTVKTAAGTGIALTTSTGGLLQCDGTNVIDAVPGSGGGIASVLADTSPQAGGDFDMNSHVMQWSKGTDVASASALTPAGNGNYYDVTGTTAITSIATTGLVGTVIKLHFDGTLTLTHHATDLILPGGANITTAAGDEAEFIEYASGDFRCTNYQRASGLPVVGSGTTDADAVHFSTANEFAGVSNKASAVNADRILIEDSADSYNKKYIDIEDLPGVSTPTECLVIAVSDETTALTTGTAKVTFRMPYAFTLTGVRASVGTAPTGATIIVDINESGTTILSTKLSIDTSEKTSTTATSAAVISDTALADDAEITIDIDQVGSTIAGAGLKVYLIGNQ